MTTDFKNGHLLRVRKAESARIRLKHPNKIPVICEKISNDRLVDLPNKKFLVPSDITIGQFVYILRKHIQLSPETAIFLFINNLLPPSSKLMGEMYNMFSDADGFLYVRYGGETVFG